MKEDKSFPLYKGANFSAGFWESHIFYAEIKGEPIFKVEDAKELLETGLRLGKGKKMYNLFVLEKTLIPSEDVLDYVTSDEVTEFTLAQAFVIKSLPQRLLGNFLIRFKNPRYPMKLFNSIDVALNWIRLMKSENENQT